MKFFGSSGIRGLANIEITPLFAQKLGLALAAQFEGGAILIGRDTRLSGKMLEMALSSGIVSSGVAVGSLGIVPTPVVALLTREMRADAGVSITASHNPPQYNGLKIFDSTGMAYTEEKQEGLEDLIEKEDYTRASWSTVGRREDVDGRRLYIDYLTQMLVFAKEWKIVCDLFNGAACTIAPDMFQELGLDATLINAQPDGYFPSGNPEPDSNSLQRLGVLVRSTGADIGFGFDGDCDRMVAVDERGDIPKPDRVLAAYARHIVENKGGGIVVTHVGASMSVKEAVEKAGGEISRTKVGDVYLTEEILRKSAVFGGEPVGAWVHPDVHLCPDGLLSAMKLLEALEDEGESLSGFISKVPEYPIMRDKIECPNIMKSRTIENVSKEYDAEFGEVVAVSKVDGFHIELDDGWVLIRPSGTEPFIRITVEARNKKRAETLLNTSRNYVMSILRGRN